MEWLSTLFLEMAQFFLDKLLEIFSADLAYFKAQIPIYDEVAAILIAVGWAILIGNLVFQAARSMMSGIGVEGEEPQILFTRTFLFGFLLVASRQICEIGLTMTGTIMELLQMPDAVTFTPLGEQDFGALPNAGWLIVIILNLVIFWQLFRLCLEVAERYVVLMMLVLTAPLAFGCGGSKSTHDIFTGWARMFVSMCVLVPLNLIFMKFLLAVLSTSANGAAIIPWAMLAVGIARTARHADSIITRIGLNPAQTGDPLGNRLPGMLTMLAIRSMGGAIRQSAATMQGNSGGNAKSAPHAPKNGSGMKFSQKRSNSGSPKPNANARKNAQPEGTPASQSREKRPPQTAPASERPSQSPPKSPAAPQSREPAANARTFSPARDDAAPKHNTFRETLDKSAGQTTQTGTRSEMGTRSETHPPVPSRNRDPAANARAFTAAHDDTAQNHDTFRETLDKSGNRVSQNSASPPADIPKTRAPAPPANDKFAANHDTFSKSLDKSVSRAPHADAVPETRPTRPPATPQRHDSAANARTFTGAHDDIAPKRSTFSETLDKHNRPASQSSASASGPMEQKQAERPAVMRVRGRILHSSPAPSAKKPAGHSEPQTDTPRQDCVLERTDAPGRTVALRPRQTAAHGSRAPDDADRIEDVPDWELIPPKYRSAVNDARRQPMRPQRPKYREMPRYEDGKRPTVKRPPTPRERRRPNGRKPR